VALTDSLRRLAAGLVELLHTRIELLSVELQELAVAGAQALVRAAAAAVLLLMGLACGVAALVLVVPPEQRAGLLAALALLVLALAAWLGWSAVQGLKALGRPLGSTLEEMARDRDALTPAEAPRS